MPEWPDDLPEPVETPEGTLLPKPTADVVKAHLAASELLPGAAARALAKERDRLIGWADELVGIKDAEAETQVTEALRDAGATPWWSIALWVGAAAAAALGIGVAIGVALDDSASVVVAP